MKVQLMNRFNDIDKSNWKDSSLITDSLWLFPTRDNSGKHDGEYHGNFIPQVAQQLFGRYTKKGDCILDPFVGSGTSAFVAESMKRNLIGYDINPDLTAKINSALSPEDCFIDIRTQDSTHPNTVDTTLEILKSHGKKSLQFAILHPPYHDIIKFTSYENDLSNSADLPSFLSAYAQVVENTMALLDRYRYLAVVIGDKYANSQWVPLGFYCMQKTMELGMTLKSIIVKDIQGNRGKKNQNTLWRYRALMSDYHIFKHEYILIFKKTKP